MREQDGNFIIPIDESTEVYINELQNKIKFTFQGKPNEYRINADYDLSKAKIGIREVMIPRKISTQGHYIELLHG